MKRRKGNQRRTDNKGISLLEVVVAITILAIVSCSLLHAFITSTRFNMRAKERQRMTTAAQSIMEGLKAFNLEEICLQFDGASPFQIYSAAADKWEIDLNGDGNTSIQNIAGSQKFVPADDGKYTFAIENISYEGQTFDAKVELFPKTAGVDVYYAEDMNEYKDAVYRQAVDLDSNAYSEILQNVLNKLNDLDGFYEYELLNLDKTKIFVNKATTVTISESGSVQKVDVSCSYTYGVTGYPYYDDHGVEHTWNSSPSDFASVSYSYPVYDNTATSAEGAKLENVWLYYYPAYKSSIGGAPINSETIDIQNLTSETKDVYLVKQKRGVSNLLTLENTYTPVITGDSKVHLFHNLNTNLASPGGTCGTVSLSGFGSTSTELLQKKTEYLMYSVTVSICAQGEAANGFPAEPLLELKGSVNGM